MALNELVEESLGAAINDFVDDLKLSWAASPRVRDVSAAWRVGLEIPQEFDAGMVAKSPSVGAVAGVHGDQDVKMRQVVGGQLLRALLGDVDAQALFDDALASNIRSFANVVVAGAARFDVESVGEPALLDVVPKNAFCQGRTADVAQAEEHDARLIHQKLMRRQAPSGWTAIPGLLVRQR